MRHGFSSESERWEIQLPSVESYQNDSLISDMDLTCCHSEITCITILFRYWLRSKIQGRKLRLSEFDEAICKRKLRKIALRGSTAQSCVRD